MAGKLISDLNSGTLSIDDAMEIDKDVSGTRTSFKTTVKDIVQFANQNIADEYDSTSTYAVDDYVIYESALYKCIASTTGTFDSTKWTSVVVTDEMGSGGGGGTGGHTIIDENGNSMTARAGLQFVGGANLSDDPTNNKTIVDLASAGGIDGVFYDTNNVIASGTLNNGSQTYVNWEYTASEDCLVGVSTGKLSNKDIKIYINNRDVLNYGTGWTFDSIRNYIPLKKGQTYKITNLGNYSSYAVLGIQTGTTHSKFQPVIYSTEEREIGVWTDGKPIYEKTFVLSSTISLVSNGWTEITEISKSGIEQIVSVTGYGDSSSNGYLLDGLFADTAGTTGIRLLNPRSTNTSVKTVTLQYTKSTDTVGSGSWTPQGVPTVHYSEQEHIVGTWIDGKTLYEKTIDFGALPNATTKVVNHDISNIDYIVSAIGSATTSAKGMFPIPFVNDQTVGGQVMLMVNTSSVTVRTSTDRSEYINCYITIRYTKTS